MWSVLTPLLPKLSEHLGAWTIILGFCAGAFTFIGWDWPPYANQKRVEKIEDNEQQAQRILLDLQRGTWEQRKQRAQTELMKNPESLTAQETLDRAARAIKTIDRQIARMDKASGLLPTD